MALWAYYDSISTICFLVLFSTKTSYSGQIKFIYKWVQDSKLVVKKPVCSDDNDDDNTHKIKT